MMKLKVKVKNPIKLLLLPSILNKNRQKTEAEGTAFKFCQATSNSVR